MDLINSMNIAAYGMKAESDRLRIVSQNIANADSVGKSPNELPYRRKVLSFHNVLDKELGTEVVKVSKYSADKSDFVKKYQPGHPAADKDGYVSYPNVNVMVEMVDMREAQRGYEANLNVIDVSKNMVFQTINMIK